MCEVTQIIHETESVTILDYGCGNGRQYHAEKFHACWSEEKPKLYDPLTLAEHKPEGTFDGVICLDMFSRITESKHAQICQDLCAYATKFLFVVVPPRLRSRIEPLLEVHCRLEIVSSDTATK